MENTSSGLDDLWGAGLPCDLARCIGDRLDDLARIYFRAVCRSWRAALPVGRRVSSVPSPMVVIPAIPRRILSLPLDRSILDSCGDTTTSSSSSTALPLHIVVDSRLQCVGSSGWWLAVADSDSVIRLVNALTLQEAARLPPLPRRAPQVPCDLMSILLGLNPTILDCEEEEHTIHKVAFSVKPPSGRGSSGYAHSVVALHRATGRGQGLAVTFTRSGWDHWVWKQPRRNEYPICSEDGQFDVAYCQRSGEYYVVTPLGLVWVLNMSAPVPTVEPLVRLHESLRSRSLTERRHLVVLPDNDDGGHGDGAPSQMYLVIIDINWGPQFQLRLSVVVHRYTAGEPWSVASDLRGRALLISSRAESVAVVPTAASLPWLRADCVYWMDLSEYLYAPATEQPMSPVWSFHVPTNTINRFLRRHEELRADYDELDWHNSLWLTPSLK